jgi:hypothetical protein
MFETLRSITELRQTNMASFRSIEAKVASFIAQAKANFPGIMTGFHSSYHGWKRQWAILTHMEREIIVSCLKQLSFGQVLALLLYRRDGRGHF